MVVVTDFSWTFEGREVPRHHPVRVSLTLRRVHIGPVMLPRFKLLNDEQVIGIISHGNAALVVIHQQRAKALAVGGAHEGMLVRA